MPMDPYTKRKEPPYFVSSDSSLPIRRHDTKSPRVCNNPQSSSTYKLSSEKSVILPKGNTKVLVVDSSGEKHTTLVDTNEVQNIDILKVIKMEEDSLKSIHKEKLSRKGNERNKEYVEDIKRKVASTRLRRNRVLCHKSRRFSIFSKSYSNPRQKQSTSTQTENFDSPILKEDRHLIGLRRSSSQILYQDNESIHQNQEAPSSPPEQTDSAAAGDGNELNRAALNPSNANQNTTGREQQVRRDPLQDIFKHRIGLHFQPETMSGRDFTAYRTAQRFSVVETRRPRPPVQDPCVLIRQFKKFNTNGNLRRVLSVILFFAILSWFFQAICKFSFPTDIFRAIFNYLYSLPIFEKSRRRELTKAEIALKYIGNFYRFLGSIFSN